MPFGSRLCIAAGPAAVCFPEPDRLLPTAVVCRAFTASGRGHLSASFFIRSGLLSCRISLCGEPVRSSTAVRVRLSARLSAFLRSGFNCRPGDPLFSGPDLPFVRSSAARRKPPPPSFPAVLLGHLFFRTLAGVDRQVALQGLLQPHRVDVAAQFAALRDRNAARLLGDYDDDERDFSQRL